MKVRKDFVTNSSSSSQVCEICGAEASGWDMGLYDAEMVQCENGHVFCEYEMMEPTREEMIKILENYVAHDKWADKVWNDDDGLTRLMQIYLSEYEGRYDLSSELCPICQLEVMNDSDFMSYTSKKYDIDKNKLLAEIKEQFGTYDKFREWLKGK